MIPPELPPTLQLVEHLLLIFLSTYLLYPRSNNISKLIFPHDSSFPAVRSFFNAIFPFLEAVYPLVDAKKASTGRPPVDHHFQLLFVIWEMFFGRKDIAKSLRTFNRSPELKKLLQCPVKIYYQSTYHRFLVRIGPDTMKKIHRKLALVCIKLKIIRAKRLIIDGFPIFSYLNTLKCLRNAKLELCQVKAFFTELRDKMASLRLDDILPKLKGNAIPHRDKLKAYLFHILWNMPSKKGNVARIKDVEGLEAAIQFEKRCPGVLTYSRCVKEYESSQHFGELQRRLLQLLSTISLLKDKVGDFSKIGRLEELRGIINNPHVSKDVGAQMNYNSSKRIMYWGRGGYVIICGDSGLPLLMGTWSSAVMSKEEFYKFIKEFKKYYGRFICVKDFVGDGEFDMDGIEELVKEELGANARFTTAKLQNGVKGRKKWWKVFRIGVERSISRMSENFGLEHPHILGDKLVELHTHLIGVCQLLQALALHQMGFKDRIRSITLIRG